MKHKGLNQLVCAAVVNNGFRQTLLRDPVQALSGGYMDQNFALTSEERDLVIGIQAQKLEDFAAQVYHWVSGNGNGHGSGRGNGNGNGSANGHATGNGHRSGRSNGNGSHGTEEPLVELVPARTPALV